MKQFNTICFLGAAALAMTACSGSNSGTQFLKSTDVSISQVGNDSYINLSAVVDLGSAQFDNATVDIFNPHTNINIGSVTFSDVAGTSSNNQGKITLQVNASVLNAADATLGNSLPNGGPLPASLGLAAGESLGIRLLNDSRIYVGGDLKTKIFAGVALSIPALNPATSGINVGANVFFSVPFSSVLTGVAGLYTSPTANDNGIAVFGQYKTAAAATTLVTQQQQKDAKERDFSDYNRMSTRQKNKLMNFFYGKKRILHVQ